MVLEVADIVVKPGREADFEAGVAKAAAIFAAAPGCRGMKLLRTIETPGQYRLLVEWDTVEDHTVAFRNSDDFKAWRALVGDCFAEPPRVDHGAVVFETGPTRQG